MENNIRLPKFANRVYSADPVRLREDIEIFLRNEPLDGLPPSQNLAVLKSPHIDYLRGYRSYGRAYQQIIGASFDLVFLIGTSHQASRYLFHGTRSFFATSLGVHPTDLDIVDRIASLYGERFFADEDLHENEHSLELQLPFLTATIGLVPLVPILVGGLHPLFGKGIPSQFEPYESFVTSLGTVLDELDRANKRYCFIAGVDMAHVGNFFGDPGNLLQAHLEAVQQKDLEYLNIIAQGEPSDLYHHAAGDYDSRRLCGHSTMVTICDLFKRRGEKLSAVLTAYEQCFTPDNDCCVTIAGMGLYRQ